MAARVARPFFQVFFSFFVGAAGIGDADFIDAPAGAGDFGGHFGLDAETAAFEFKSPPWL